MATGVPPSSPSHAPGGQKVPVQNTEPPTALWWQRRAYKPDGERRVRCLPARSMAARDQVAARAELQVARTCFRRCHTAVQAALTAWDAAQTDGRAALEVVCNSRLQLTHFEHLDLASLRNTAGLQAAAERKLKLRWRSAHERLAAAVENMTRAAQGMQAAQMDAAEAAERLTLVEARPPFACLSLRQVAAMLGTISGQHAAQLQVRCAA